MKTKPAMQAFVGKEQAAVIRSAMRGEEGLFFKEKMASIDSILFAMPTTGETDHQGDEAVVYLHYFRGSCDVWVTELDKGAEGDTPEDYQSQAFGVVDMGHGPEWGYVSIPEILAAGMELDMYWRNKTVSEIKAKKERAA